MLSPLKKHIIVKYNILLFFFLSSIFGDFIDMNKVETRTNAESRANSIAYRSLRTERGSRSKRDPLGFTS